MGSQHEIRRRRAGQDAVGETGRTEFLRLFERYRDDIVEPPAKPG
jgi:hypothetical protein